MIVKELENNVPFHWQLCGKPEDFGPCSRDDHLGLETIVRIQELVQSKFLTKRVMFLQFETPSFRVITDPKIFISRQGLPEFKIVNSLPGAIFWSCAPTDQVVAATTADAPIGLLWAPKRPRTCLVALLARPNLVSLNSSGQSVLISEMVNVFSRHGLQAEDLCLKILPGVGPCCYGFSDQRVIESFRLANPNFLAGRKVVCGPRQGQEAISLVQGVVHLATQNGLLERNISYNNFCPACAGRSRTEEGEFHSHVWDHRLKKNLVLIQLIPSLV